MGSWCLPSHVVACACCGWGASPGACRGPMRNGKRQPRRGRCRRAADSPAPDERGPLAGPLAGSRFFNRSEHTVAPRWPQCAPGGEGGRRGRASVREGGRWVRRAARGGCRHARLPPRRCCGALRLCDQVLCPCACSSAAPVQVLTYCGRPAAAPARTGAPRDKCASALNLLFFNRGFPRPVRRRRRRCRRALARGSAGTRGSTSPWRKSHGGPQRWLPMPSNFCWVTRKSTTFLEQASRRARKVSVATLICGSTVNVSSDVAV
jgi:hypothetical protein